MSDPVFSEKDIEQIKARGIPLARVLSQIETFKNGFPFANLKRPCTVGDGIAVIGESDLKRLARTFTQAALSGRAMKFVPASGSATRMFQPLLSFNNRLGNIDEITISVEAENGGSDSRAFLRFIKEIEEFAFYEDLKSVIAENGLDIRSLISNGKYKDILEYTLTPKGLDYTDLPKGLIKFHRYQDHCRTPIEEHLVEAAEYVRDGNKVARIHFTVPSEHEERIIKYIEEALSRYESAGARYEITFSVQKPSTDTIAADLNNRPFRDKDGKLVFRPGGHGALLENLNELQGDIVFIKNIDSVVPDRLKRETYVYKKALGGYLIEIQEEIFGYLKKLSLRDVDERLLGQIFEFTRHKLSIVPPEEVEYGSRKAKIDFLFSKLNRPLRVCGMVKNQGEPGGGPFWIEHEDGTQSLQIVESSQVDMKSSGQRAVWESSTHFNPVDLVCGVRDYLGQPFDLTRFTDPNVGFISIKSKDGRDLKAIELPGLWNGGMANWNTVFVEVPITTFSPVKTVFDLLRKEHQPE